MLDNKKLQNIIKLAELKGRLKELEETRGYLDSSVYYNNRRISLKNQVERLVAEVLGLKITAKRPPRKVYFFTEEEPVSQMMASVKKELISEKVVKPEIQFMADMFGFDVPEKEKNIEQYVMTTIEGFLR